MNTTHTIPNSQFLSFCSHSQRGAVPKPFASGVFFFFNCISQVVSSLFQLQQQQKGSVDIGFQLPAKAIKKHKTPEANSFGTAHSDYESKRRESVSQEQCEQCSTFPILMLGQTRTMQGGVIFPMTPVRKKVQSNHTISPP